MKVPQLLASLVLAFAARPAWAEDEASRPSVHAGAILHLGLGVASTLGPGPGEGPAFRMGYRFESARFGLDVELGATMDFATVGGAKGSPRAQSVAGVFPRVAALWFMNDPSLSSPFLSGGLSLSGASQSDGNETFRALGPSAEIGAGYEWFRDGENRVFVELGATLPFFPLRAGDAGFWAPTFFVLIGAGAEFHR